MPNQERAVLIVDDAPDYRLTIGALLRKNFPDARILKVDGTESAIAALENESDMETVRLVIDGLEGGWKDLVIHALALGIPRENMIIFSATENIQNEAEEMEIQFKLKPDGDKLEVTIFDIGTILRL